MSRFLGQCWSYGRLHLLCFWKNNRSWKEGLVAVQGRLEYRAEHRQRGWRPERVKGGLGMSWLSTGLKPGRRNGERLGWGHECRQATEFSNFSETHNKKHFAYQDPGNTHLKNKKNFQKYLSLHLYMNVYNQCLEIK